MNNQLDEFIKAKTGNYLVPIKDGCKKDGEYSEAYPIGFPILDDGMKAGKQTRGGVRGGDLIVITGMSKNGKTTFAQNITLNLDKIGIPTIFFSYEVNIDNLYAKFKEMGISDEALIYTPKEIITGKLEWIKEKAKEGKDRFYTKAIFIDDLDFLSPSESDSQLRNKIRNILMELKQLAVSEDMVIFLIAHIKKVQGREVEMQDLGESSSLYQKPDFVFMVKRYDETDIITGIKYKGNRGVIRTLANRLTGDEPFMEFAIKNNIIIPSVYE